MESNSNEDLAARTAQLRRQLLEKLQPARNGSAARPTMSTDAAPNPAPHRTGPYTQQALLAALQQDLPASKSDLDSFLEEIISTNRSRFDPGQTPAPVSPIPAALEVARAPMMQTPSFVAHGNFLQNSLRSLEARGGYPMSYEVQPPPPAEPHMMSASRALQMQEAERPAWGRSSNVSESGSRGVMGLTDGAFDGLPSFVARQQSPSRPSSMAARASEPTGAEEADSLASLGASLHLSPEELADVSDWLLHTNFYDVEYRQKFLSRRRRLAELEEERLKLLQEDDEENKQYGGKSSAIRGFTPFKGRVYTSPIRPPPDTASRTAGSPSVSVPPLAAPSVASKPAIVSPPAAVPHHHQAAAPADPPPPLPESDRLELQSLMQHDGPGDRSSEKRMRPEKDDQNTQAGDQERPSKIVRTEPPAPEPAVARPTHTLPPAPATVSASTAEGPSKETQPSSSVGHAPQPQAPGAAQAPSAAQAASTQATSSAQATSAAQTPSAVQTAGAAQATSSAQSEPSNGKPANGNPANSNPANGNPNPHPGVGCSGSPQGPLRPAQKLRSKPSSDKIKDEEKELERLQLEELHGGHAAKASVPNSGHLTNTDCRYFMLKPASNNVLNKARKYHVWTTTESNGEVLREAFQTSSQVVLFFSVNRSRGYQGVAKMASEPTTNIPTHTWMGLGKQDVSPPFKIKWVKNGFMSYHVAYKLKNSYDAHNPVCVSSNGQEIDPGCGQKLFNLMMTTELESLPVAEASPQTKTRSKPNPKPQNKPNKKVRKGENNQAVGRSWSRPYVDYQQGSGYDQPHSQPYQQDSYGSGQDWS